MMERVVKPSNNRTKRALEDREPKAIENTKKVLFIKGSNVSETVQKCMKDIYLLKKPNALMYNKKNDIRPFEDATKLELYSKKEDCSIFFFGNSNKKRPHNVILGRMYDYHLLDMIELGIDDFKSLNDFKNEKTIAEIKSCLLFSGEAFEKNDEMRRLKTLLIDFFRGPEVTNIRLSGLEHALQFTATDEGKISMRSYKILLKNSREVTTPRVELEEIGPSIDFSLRRSHIASPDLYKTACKQVKNVYKAKKVKNIEQDDFGTTLGRLHVPSQDINKIQTRKMKGLKKSKKKQTPKETKN